MCPLYGHEEDEKLSDEDEENSAQNVGSWPDSYPFICGKRSGIDWDFFAHLSINNGHFT
jgi:hypothetical protein